MFMTSHVENSEMVSTNPTTHGIDFPRAKVLVVLGRTIYL
jgi:hypothetical protein